MSYKKSKTPTQIQIDTGWSENMKDVHVTFERHGKLLLLLYKLEIIPARYVSILCKDFEQKIWAQIRDGDDYDY